MKKKTIRKFKKIFGSVWFWFHKPKIEKPNRIKKTEPNKNQTH
jgi:hypothetical protein